MINFNIFFFKRCILYASDENLNKENNYNSIENEYNELKNNDKFKTQILNQNIADKIFKRNLDIVDKSSITITEADINNIIHFFIQLSNGLHFNEITMKNDCVFDNVLNKLLTGQRFDKKYIEQITQNNRQFKNYIYKDKLKSSSISNYIRKYLRIMLNGPLIKELVGFTYIHLGGIKFNFKQTELKIMDLKVDEIKQVNLDWMIFISKNKEYYYTKKGFFIADNCQQSTQKPKEIETIFSDIEKIQEDLVDFISYTITTKQKKQFFQNQKFFNNLEYNTQKKIQQQFFEYKYILGMSVLIVMLNFIHI